MIWKLNFTILLTCIFLIATSSTEADQGSSVIEEQTAPFMEKGKQTDTIFKFEKKDTTSLIQLRGTGANRQEMEDNTGTFGLEVLGGQLFSPSNDQFDGYYFMSGKLESDNRQRFNATLGYFLPVVGGETKLTYRLFHADVKDKLALSDGFEQVLDSQFEESALEQGFGFSYRKRVKIVIREIAFQYSYTHLGGESVKPGSVLLDTPTVLRKVNPDIGFGDVDSQEALLQVAAGTDFLDNRFFKGIRLDLGSGYQDVQYGSFHDIGEVSDKGFSGVAALKACTPIGVLKVGYQDSPAAQTVSAGYQLGGLDVFFKDIDYEYGEDEQIVGVAFTVDMLDTDAAFDRNCPRFFYPSDTGYANVSQMQHVGSLASDHFTAKPRVSVIYDDVFRVDKTGLPENVRVDDSDPDDPGLIVSTGCSQERILSVDPPSAGSAFGISGSDIRVALDGLPNDRQTIVARFDDRCCGDTRVQIATDAAGTAVTSVHVQEGVDCVQVPETGQPQQPETTPQCLAIGSVCSVGNDTCCPGTICDFAYNNGFTSVFLCQ
jgi:hypothetical protein